MHIATHVSHTYVDYDEYRYMPFIYTIIYIITYIITYVTTYIYIFILALHMQSVAKNFFFYHDTHLKHLNRVTTIVSTSQNWFHTHHLSS